VVREAVAVQEDDGDGAEALGARRLQLAPHVRLVERPHDVAAGAHALVDLHHLPVEQLRQLDVAVEDARPVLVGDAQLVAEPLRDEEDRVLALALEERIGRDGGAHLHRLDLLHRDRLARLHAQEVADAGQRGVAILLRVFRQQLVGGEGAVRAPRHHVRERAAAIDPELPAVLHRKAILTR
jgi:hypothetical protein